MNGLMVAFAFWLPYHVLRTARKAGVRVHVLGSGPSRGLRTSRFCSSYQTSQATGNGENDAEMLLAEIRKVVERRRIDIVFPSDDVSTRLLTVLKDRLPVRTSLLPDPATFDLLNEKWNFCRFAADIGARVPQTWLYDSITQLRQDLGSGRLSLPLTLKPTNRSGGIGVMHVRDAAELTALDAVDYAPILVQRYIVGKTIGISVLCRGGRIAMHATQWYDDHRFRLFANPDLVDNAAKIVAAARLDGPAFFDAILEEATGLSYIVECNPRFWFSMYMPALLGLNFAQAAFTPTTETASEAVTSADLEICRSRAILGQPWRANPQDWRYHWYQWGDPLAYVLQRRRTFDDRDVAVAATRMSPYKSARSDRISAIPTMRLAEPVTAATPFTHNRVL